MPVQEPPSPHRSPGKWARLGSGLATRWTQAKASAPTTLALLVVAAVWAFGAFWSFTEQKAFAANKGFTDTPVLPLVLDGFAIAMALVAYAASLDGRPAVPARLGIVFGVVASAASNGVWAAQRSTVNEVPDWTAVVIAVAVPVFANIAFEVLLAELRRQVDRRRGLPAPLPLPTLRPIRLVLAPWPTFKQWRDEVLIRTAVIPLDDPSRWGGPDKVTATAVDDSSSPAATAPPDSESRSEIGPSTAPPLLHLMPAPAPVDGALDGALDTSVPEAQPVTDPLLVAGAHRSVRQARDVAKTLGVTRRPEWNTARFNEEIDKHLRKHGPKPVAS